MLVNASTPDPDRTSPFDFRYIFDKLVEKTEGANEVETSFISEIRCTRDGANIVIVYTLEPSYFTLGKFGSRSDNIKMYQA
jgi:hypothetical protein